MNKKVIMLIVAILVLAIIGTSIFVVTKQNNNQSNKLEENIQEEGNNPEINEDANILVLYFSMSGNTETIANYIHDEVGGNIIKLETVQTYPEDYNDLVDYAQEEQSNNARPELATEIDINKYDVIFLGYPNWWGDMPMPIYSFLDEYDLSGKTIAPFITHGGSGLSGTPTNIQNEEPNAHVTEGLSIYGSRAESSKDEVIDWLNELGY